ncbi:MAG: elongation factor P maturation arginine rhamnosyltransferase EarP [Rhodocyclaceae bacterium]|nr:elongation factor P maturation arginine rhamnosyltransferase EarP [Rhodocyclaceae bacterium]
MHWAIFCRVIDNYGDAGVCWRLAVDLAQRGERVTLWIDQPEVLNLLIGPAPHDHSIDIYPWPDSTQSFTVMEVADVVIEAFACDPPAAYVAAMANCAASGKAPVWINLEYLSAEDWVGSNHKLPSPHPRYPLLKHFYFPGFTPDSGGLLREPDLMVSDGPTGTGSPLRIYLFGYAQPALPYWLAAQHDVSLSVAPCPIIAQLDANPVLPGNYRIEQLPFVPQSRFDALLQTHDLLFVRGEDSFVRAQWSALPVFWQIYPQEAATHLVKLKAFYDRYLDPAHLTARERDIFMRFILAWNGCGDRALCGSLWPEILRMRPALQANAQRWRESLLKQADLVTQLRAFVADLVK